MNNRLGKKIKTLQAQENKHSTELQHDTTVKTYTKKKKKKSARYNDKTRGQRKQQRYKQQTGKNTQ